MLLVLGNSGGLTAEYGNALWAASRCNHAMIVQTLLNAGADIDG